MPDVPQQFAIPPRVAANGQLATVDQASPQDVGQRIAVLCRTPPGYLTGGRLRGTDQTDLDRTSFGLADQAFQEGGADLTLVEQQIATHVTAWVGDTAAQIAFDEDRDLIDTGLETIGIRVSSQ